VELSPAFTCVPRKIPRAQKIKKKHLVKLDTICKSRFDSKNSSSGMKTEFKAPLTSKAGHRRVAPTLTRTTTDGPFSPVRDLTLQDQMGGMMGLPQVHPDGSVTLTELPRASEQGDRKRAELIKKAFQRPELKREQTQEAAELEHVVEEGDDMSDGDTTDHVPIRTASPVKKASKRERENKPPSRKKRKTAPSEESTASEGDQAEVDFPEGFPGLKGWKAMGGVAELFEKLKSGELKDGAWIQYTRDASTFIPGTRYKKLQEEAKHTGRELSELVEEEKKQMLSKGRKKTLCTVSLGQGPEEEGSLVLSSIPPKGGRSSNFYPYQQRRWLLKEDTDGGIVVYSKLF
jgi:hypothetical protein